MHPSTTIDRLVNLLDPKANLLFNQTYDDAVDAVASGDASRVRVAPRHLLDDRPWYARTNGDPQEPLRDDQYGVVPKRLRACVGGYVESDGIAGRHEDRLADEIPDRALGSACCQVGVGLV